MTSTARRISPSAFQHIFFVMFLIFDAILVLLSVQISYHFRFEFISPNLSPPPREDYIALSGMYTALTIYFFIMTGLYRHTLGRSRIDEIFKIVRSVTLSLIALLALSFFYREFSYSRLITLVGAVFACILVGSERLLLIQLQRWLLKRGHGVNRLLIVGTGPGFNNAVSRLSGRPELGYELAGYVEESPEMKSLKDIPMLGAMEELEQLLVMHEIAVVVTILDPAYHSMVQEIVDICDKQEVSCFLAPDMVDLLVGPNAYEDISGLPLIRVKGLRIKGINALMKRTMDIVVSALVLILISPVLIALGLLVKLDSAGPVFYMQKRVGIDGRIFWMYKFRSMKTEVEAEKGGPGWSVNSDPRVTKLGHYLRKFSIDELPQFINVLRGDMSLVGPRPERPYFVAQFEKGVPRYMERHKVKSGLTGWAQANGLRGDTSINERVQYDLYYIENWSVWFDVKIMLLTIMEIFAELKRK